MKLCRVSLLAAALMVKTVSGQSAHRNDMVATITPPVHTHWGATMVNLQGLLSSTVKHLSAQEMTLPSTKELVCTCFSHSAMYHLKN